MAFDSAMHSAVYTDTTLLTEHVIFKFRVWLTQADPADFAWRGLLPSVYIAQAFSFDRKSLSKLFGLRAFFSVFPSSVFIVMFVVIVL